MAVTSVAAGSRLLDPWVPGRREISCPERNVALTVRRGMARGVDKLTRKGLVPKKPGAPRRGTRLEPLGQCSTIAVEDDGHAGRGDPRRNIRRGSEARPGSLVDVRTGDPIALQEGQGPSHRLRDRLLRRRRPMPLPNTASPRAFRGRSTHSTSTRSR